MTDEIKIHEVDSVTIAETSADKRGALGKRIKWFRSRKGVSHRGVHDLARQIGSLLKGEAEQKAVHEVSSRSRGLPRSLRK